MPGYGFRVYTLQTGESAIRSSNAEGRAIENATFRVEADATDGTLTLTDKRTGRVLRGLNRFVDGGDRGDEYNWCPPEDDTIVDRPAAPPTVRVETAGGEREGRGGRRIEPLDVVDRDEQAVFFRQGAQRAEEPDRHGVRERCAVDGRGPAQQRHLERLELGCRQMRELLGADAVEHVDEHTEDEPSLGVARASGQHAQSRRPGLGDAGDRLYGTK